MDRTVENIAIAAKKENCCGCGACEAVCPADAISLIMDSKGFYYPELNEAKCVGCTLCVSVCAFSK